jgi:hypothetical protein
MAEEVVEGKKKERFGFLKRAVRSFGDRTERDMKAEAAVKSEMKNTASEPEVDVPKTKEVRPVGRPPLAEGVIEERIRAREERKIKRLQLKAESKERIKAFKQSLKEKGKAPTGEPVTGGARVGAAIERTQRVADSNVEQVSAAQDTFQEPRGSEVLEQERDFSPSPLQEFSPSSQPVMSERPSRAVRQVRQPEFNPFGALGNGGGVGGRSPLSEFNGGGRRSSGFDPLSNFMGGVPRLGSGMRGARKKGKAKKKGKVKKKVGRSRRVSRGFDPTRLI